MMPILMIDNRISNPQMKGIVIVVLNTGKVDQKEECFNERNKKQDRSRNIIKILLIMIDLS